MDTNKVDNRYKYYYRYSKDTKVMDENINILTYLMSSKVINNNTSTLLTDLLNFIDTGIRFTYKYIDRLKYFKNYLKYNR